MPMYIIRSTSTGRELATVMASDSNQARKKARDYGLGNDISVSQKNPRRRRRARRNPGGYAVRYSGPKGYVDARFNTKAEATAYKKKIGRGRVVKSNPSVSGVKFTLKKVPLDSGGYTKGRSGGRYFGVGLPLYYYEDYETGDISGFLRATGKQDAVEQLRKAVQYKI